MISLKKRFTIQTYNIGIVNSDVLEKGLLPGAIRWMDHNYHDRFFADPFLWYRDNDFLYILVEELCFYEEYGKISLLKVDRKDFKLVEKNTLIQEPYHLSFPYCKEGSEIIIPESVQGKKCKKYFISLISHKIYDTIVIVDEGIVDPILFDSNNNYLLGGRKENPSSNLFLLCKDNNTKKYTFICDPETPIVKDCSCARNAGAIFSYKGKLIRPAQDCTKRYGYATKLMEITELNNYSYHEEEYMTFYAEGNAPFDETLHTFNYYGDFALVDGSKDIFAARNVIYKSRKYFKRKITRCCR